MHDDTERQIALGQLRETIGKVLGIAIDDVKEQNAQAAVNLAGMLNVGALRCEVTVDWPQCDVHIFLCGENGEEPRKLTTIVAEREHVSH